MRETESGQEQATYCQRCGLPHQPGQCRRATIAEQLDDAKDGAEFAAVILGMLR